MTLDEETIHVVTTVAVFLSVVLVAVAVSLDSTASTRSSTSSYKFWLYLVTEEVDYDHLRWRINEARLLPIRWQIRKIPTIVTIILESEGT